MWQRKPTGGRALKGVITAVSPSVLALRSEHGRDFFPRRKGRASRSGTKRCQRLPYPNHPISKAAVEVVVFHCKLARSSAEPHHPEGRKSRQSRWPRRP